MIYFPGTINIVSTWIYTSIMDSLFSFQLCTSTYSVHASILKLWRGRLPCPLVVFSFHHVSRLSSSFVRSQLTLPVPALRIRSPLSQDGAPIHRVRTHSLSRVQHRNSHTRFSNSRFFIKYLPPTRPLIHILKHFLKRQKIRQDICNSNCLKNRWVMTQRCQ
jgi:hypothetical protein